MRLLFHAQVSRFACWGVIGQKLSSLFFYLLVMTAEASSSPLSLSLSLSVLYRDFGLARARSKRTNDCAVATVDGGAARRSPNPSPSGKRAHLGGALPHSRECVPTFLTVGTDSLIIHHELLRPPGCGGGGGAPRRCITIWNAVAVLGSAAQVNPLDR